MPFALLDSNRKVMALTVGSVSMPGMTCMTCPAGAAVGDTITVNGTVVKAPESQTTSDPSTDKVTLTQAAYDAILSRIDKVDGGPDATGA